MKIIKFAGQSSLDSLFGHVVCNKSINFFDEQLCFRLIDRE